MIFGNDRNELRAMYIDAWQRAQRGETLTPLQAQIAAVIQEHPEYHALLAGFAAGDAIDTDLEPNPFLHMGLHLAIREQVATDRPSGIRAAFAALAAQVGDAHTAEHRCAEVLGETLWQAQADGKAPDERAYLAGVQKLTR